MVAAIVSPMNLKYLIFSFVLRDQLEGSSCVRRPVNSSAFHRCSVVTELWLGWIPAESGS